MPIKNIFLLILLITMSFAGYKFINKFRAQNYKISQIESRQIEIANQALKNKLLLKGYEEVELIESKPTDIFYFGHFYTLNSIKYPSKTMANIYEKNPKAIFDQINNEALVVLGGDFIWDYNEKEVALINSLSNSFKNLQILFGNHEYKTKRELIKRNEKINSFSDRKLAFYDWMTNEQGSIDQDFFKSLNENDFIFMHHAYWDSQNVSNFKVPTNVNQKWFNDIHPHLKKIGTKVVLSGDCCGKESGYYMNKDGIFYILSGGPVTNLDNFYEFIQISGNEIFSYKVSFDYKLFKKKLLNYDK